MTKTTEQAIIVTGAGRGIGNAIAQRMLQRGQAVALVDREFPEDFDIAFPENARYCTYQIDLRDSDAVSAGVSEIAQEFGGIAGLVNAAGVFLEKHLWETTEDEWDLVMDINVAGIFRMSKAASQVMADAHGGSIVNILSNASAQGFAGESAYCASKGAALLLTQTMAVELAEKGITVNGVGPGTTQTSMGAEYLSNSVTAPHELARTPLGRFGEPDDIAKAVEFLLLDASWITGQALYVDGGFLATGRPNHT